MIFISVNDKFSRFLRLALPLLVLAAVDIPTTSGQTTPANDTSITVHFDPEPQRTSAGEDGYLPRIEEIFSGSALVNGLNSGADAINRSVESLMEAVFYNLMDHEFSHPTSPDSSLALLANRHVYSTATGSYVVVDRVGFGPRYGKELWRIHGVPINLGIDGTVEVLEVYPRSDAGRIAEQKGLPTWRYWINNWLGLLPILGRILPPSFNPNELYDPLRQIEAPFSFPLSIASFETMPMGSVRSYGISGGVNLPLEIGEILDIRSRKLAAKLLGSKVQIPYTMFSAGSHRINVLRRNSKLAWVGLSTVKRTGHSLAGIVGNTLFILGQSIKSFTWAGVPIPIFPIDIELTGSLSKKFDQLYEYDLNNPIAVKAYLAAVRGDFVPSFDGNRLRTSSGQDTGIVYQFTKIQHATDALTKNSGSIFVARNGREQTRTKAEVEIRDETGIFFLLEGIEDIRDETWDLLVGSEETRTRQQVDIQVDRQANDTDEIGKYTYTFKRTNNPLDVTLNLQIADRYTDSAEYANYLAEMADFLQLPLTAAPQFPLHDDTLERQYRMNVYLRDPTQDHQLVPPTPLVLGRLNSNGMIKFNTQRVSQIADRSEDEMWGAFATAFGMDAKAWSTAQHRQALQAELLWFGRLLLYPLRILNFRLHQADAVHEAQNSIDALKAIRAAQTPIDKLQGFYRLFETDHPRRTATALLLLSEKDQIPRKVDFFTRPVSYLDPAYRVKFQNLNGVTIAGPSEFPKPALNKITEDKLNAFFPSEIRELREKPTIRNIEIFTQPSTSHGDLAPEHNHIVIRLHIEKMDPNAASQIYIRFEQAGKLQFGKLVVVEDVAPLKPLAANSDSFASDIAAVAYEVSLSGPSSPFDSFILNQALEFGGEFLLAVSTSNDGSIWSNEKEIRFRFEDGLLLPPN